MFDRNVQLVGEQLSRFVKLVVWLPVIALTAGCTTLASVPETGTEMPGPVVEEIFIATTRARSVNSAELFTGERSSKLDHGKVLVSIPPVHKIGTLERPRYGEASPKLHFKIQEQAFVDTEKEFSRQVDADLATHSPENQDILLFVHGYNTGFRESALRFSQFAHDSGFRGTTVLFTWASRGTPVEYFYDRESATIARDGLERTLRNLATTKARKVHIMAHSMGNWVAMESLRQLQIAGDAQLGDKLGEVILASPDIDVDVFKSQMRRLGRPSRPYNLLVSKDDRALGVSQWLSGNQPRIGNYANDSEIAELGINVFDLTNVQSDDRLNHGKFARAPEIVQLLGNRISAGNKLAENEVRFSDRLQSLTRNIGGAVATTAEIVVYTPQTVLTRPDQIITAPAELLNGTAGGTTCSDCEKPDTGNGAR